ncbi:flavin-containing monooxygenase [Methylobacterium sp. ID0610]|uniref:flavin-containing monooxygenase n=1 Tax=Methylobacterium carpenticola TaxID=3344827 RepID=UPI0036781761
MPISVEDSASAAQAIDLDALRRRYAEERDKRLREEGVGQYIPAEGDFAYFVDDPYVEPVKRAPIVRAHRAAVIGGGFGGILTAIHLKKAGIDDVLIIEKAGGFGGVWYWNRFPGLACDMKSYVYLPLLEEVGYMPPRNYASGEEIRQHAERLVDHFGLRDHGLFQTEVTQLRWLAEESLWLISTAQGDRIKAKYVVTATGVFSRPKLPGIKGIDRYKGHTFHSGRWDYAYTGGSPEGGLTGLAGKTVAIVGTGATAVQVIPHLAAAADHLYVVQRTPSGVDIREEKPTDPEWAASLAPGWQQRMVENFTALTSGAPAEEDLVNDGWTFLFTRMGALGAGGASRSLEEMMLAAEYADAEKMNEIRARIDAIVQDKATAERLKPWYRRFCKRPVFHDGYLETFNRDTVTLLDTHGRGIDEITENAIVVAGQSYPVDCIIFASGFEIGADSVLRNGFGIIGRDGRNLAESWSRTGIRTFHGMLVAGFPNLFIHQVAQGALSANFCHGLNEMSQHMAHVIGHAERAGAKEVEVLPAAEEEWVGHCAAVGGLIMDFLKSCTPGYYNAEGKIDEEGIKGYGYGLGPVMFFNIIKSWRDDGGLRGLDLRSAA